MPYSLLITAHIGNPSRPLAHYPEPDRHFQSHFKYIRYDVRMSSLSTTNLSAFALFCLV